ncbi:Qat anti-phage system ATPase QatA [Gudongella sp. DL1XJH-153]|uniref:Qat anti-phage system ATPase QatA n=1 Tax=Gudongella sp. DL1XJH-153 TaxID=3409804 RepID=UPI003BB548C4
MILSDNETKVDMLNNRAIAKTVVELINESREKPISIGVHGDWGAGKSSILEMVEDEFKSKDDIECIKFNGWKHQGFEDAKIALMSSIVSTLVEKRNLSEVCADKVKKVWKSINWLSVAKTAGNFAFSASTGVLPIGLITGALDVLKGNLTDQEKIGNTIDSIGSYLTDSKIFEDVSMSKEFTEFQKSFSELLEASSIKKLVVLIDDLDRCLPEVTIETLEAVRLFMFSNSTAFVIAADETMIEYAVKNHFPDLTDTNNKNLGAEFSRRYLEKLIQVPFRLPVLGEIESEMYIKMLLIGSKLEDDSCEFNRLLTISVEKMKKPWKNQGLTITEMNEALDTKYELVIGEITIATQISAILARHTNGNPRKIKRFINMLLLRKKMADARGYGDEVVLPYLAKIMLAESFFDEFYEDIASQTNDQGYCDVIRELETEVLNLGKQSEEDQKVDDAAEVEQSDKKVVSITKNSPKVVEWAKDNNITKWVMTEPKLGEKDLRPYFFACKEKQDYFFNQIKSEKLRIILDKLMSTSMNIASVKEEVKVLSPDDVKIVYDALASKILAQSNISNKPNGIEGIICLVSLHQNLQMNLVSLIEMFDIKTVGVWICNGWSSCITSAEAKSRLSSYLDKLRRDGTTFVKAALKSM